MKKYIFPILFIAIGFVACETGGVKWKSTDLIKHGFPLSIMAPDSAEVIKDDMGVLTELSITGAGNYGLLIQSSEAITTNPKSIKDEELTDVKSNRIFSKVILDDENGFVYETRLDSANVSYEFFLVKIQGDREYRFKTPYTGSFSEEEAKKVYESLK